MKKVNFSEYSEKVAEKLTSGGIFLTTSGKKTNTMTIGWMTTGIIWGKPFVTVLVRKSRYTHQLIEKAGEFTVSAPLASDLKEELAFCGSHSGRDCDKFEECGLTEIEGREVETPVIGECDLHYECRIQYKQDMKPENLDDAYQKQWYPESDYHTLYYGEILSCYRTD